MTNVVVLNGPNLNLLGHREPEVYGDTTLIDLEDSLREQIQDNTRLEFFQTNHEGEMIERIHQLVKHPVDGIIINPGAWSHTSIALRDALAMVSTPIIEVHISNIHAREAFRNHSYISEIASGVIVGFGISGYKFALQMITSREENR